MFERWGVGIYKTFDANLVLHRGHLGIYIGVLGFCKIKSLTSLVKLRNFMFSISKKVFFSNKQLGIKESSLETFLRCLF